MSQTLQQQNNGPADSPAGHHLPPSSLNIVEDTGHWSKHRAVVPSPLQTTTTATRATKTHSISSPKENNSPEACLDLVLASESSFSKPEKIPADPNSRDSIQRLPHPGYEPNGALQSSSNTAAIVLTSKALRNSPPRTSSPMATNVPQPQTEMPRAAPRTSSIDSAISSLSTGHSSKSSTDATSGSPHVATLIAAAGSAEGVIQYLLKEKQSQAAQNAQLWRLVDKQRAMILGLNKDLERALKDKERYRKKVKESMAQASNASLSDYSKQDALSEAGLARADSDASNRIKSSSAEDETKNTFQQRERLPSPVQFSLAPYPITPMKEHHFSKESGEAPRNMNETEQDMSSLSQHVYLQYHPDTLGLGFGASQQQGRDEIERELPYEEKLQPPRKFPGHGEPPSLHLPSEAATQNKQNPSFAVIEPTPNPDEDIRTFPSPLPRKAPPPPLNLRKNDHRTNSHRRTASGPAHGEETNESDTLELDGLRERGRRKTREEDERIQELSANQNVAALRGSSKTAMSSTSTPINDVAVERNLGSQVPSSDADKLRYPSPPNSSPRSLAAALKKTVVSNSSPLSSPGLPPSPRPRHSALNSPMTRGSLNSASVTSPPMSPRMNGVPGSMPLSPRAPRQPIPLPPNTPMSLVSPGIPKELPLQLSSPKPLFIPPKMKTTNNNDNSKGNSTTASSQQDVASPSSQHTTASMTTPLWANREGIYQGLVTQEYPELLVAPNALPSIDVKVASSRLKPSRSSIMFPKNIEEDPVFTLAVSARSNGTELWRIEKDSQSLGQLDQSLKRLAAFTASIPDKSLFSGHAPAKVDARRAALERYFEEILDTQMDTPSALEICKYLSSSVLEAYATEVTYPSIREAGKNSPVKTGPGGRPLKNGYLTKRGKNFGGWKARYFVLDGPIFKYYESPGGPHLGTIKLQNARIGKQSQPNENQSPSRGDAEDPDSQYRHAFLILEPKRKDSSSLVRHVLCAESDMERDQWVDTLCQYIEYKDSDEEGKKPHSASQVRDRKGSPTAPSGSKNKKKVQQAAKKNRTQAELTEDNLRTISYEHTKPPDGNPGLQRPQTVTARTPSPSARHYETENFPSTLQALSSSASSTSSTSNKIIPAPKISQTAQDSSSSRQNNLLAPAFDDKIKLRKRSFFGFGTKVKAFNDSGDVGTDMNNSSSSLSQKAYEQHGPIRPAFGVPLADAVKYNHPADNKIPIPAVVYRCIEYLDAKNAAGEEGIFRLSGSNIVIKQLRQRFNEEGDVNLLADDQFYDIHAIASLLKLFLRELPATILTRELHLEFVRVTELADIHEKISALRALVLRLPRVNNTLLRYLTAFLINIISHSDTNKMTVRNVGIVFSPTLNIPAPVFALFLQQYAGIFEKQSDHLSQPVESAPSLLAPEVDASSHLPTPPKFQPPMPKEQFSAQPPPPPPTMAGSEYGGKKSTLAGPAYDLYNGGAPAYRPHGSESPNKSKRRESSMFGMTVSPGQRQNRTSKLRNERFADNQSYFH